ncbi:MAG: hypothetical protein EA401_01560 [Planctomycetota bacterium]|nr:MAG: hypothetical protein EA401_01560 [Planctomycetota bacterium]
MLIGFLQAWVERWLLEQTVLPGVVTVLCLMLVMIGVLASILVFVQVIAQQGLESTRGIAEALPFPKSLILWHIGIFFVIFLLYAWVYQVRWQPW